LPLLFALLLSTAPVVARAGDAVLAAWKRNQIEFTYMGFTTLYTCDGLRGKVKSLLRHVGAREDVKVTTSGCEFHPGEIARLPRLRLDFHVPVLRESGARDAGPPVPAEWKTVVIRRDQPKHLGVGDCELVEQFHDHVLPAFTTRDVAGRMTCVPHQLSGSGFDLRFMTLMALPSPDSRPVKSR
jgi:hypothetical protein